MKASNKIIASLTVATLATVLMAGVLLWAFVQIDKSSDAWKRTSALISGANEILADVMDAETGERGYVLTGDERFLAPYLAVRAGIKGRLTELRSQTSFPAAQQHLDALLPLIEARLAQAVEVVELRRHGNLRGAIAVVRSGRSKQTMDSVRAELASYVQLENSKLDQQRADYSLRMGNMFVVIVAISVLGLLLVIIFAYQIYQETQNRIKNVVHLETRHLLDIQEESNNQLRQANATLQVSEERLAVTLNSIGDAVIATDAEGYVTLLNPLAERLTGWTLAEAANRSIDEIFNIVNQETRQPPTLAVRETLRNGTIKGLANHTVLIARDGSECDIADSCAPICDRDGQVVGAILVFRDVTDEETARQALRDSAALIKAILNTMADGVITIHASGGIIERTNAAAERMFGYSADELVGQNFSLLIPELERDQRNGSLEVYSASDEARAIGHGREVTGRRKDGGIFPLEMAVSETWLGGKRYFTGILRDITVRNRIEAERNEAMVAAEKASRAKTDFLSSMSHELRTPLNAILGFAQLMEAGLPPPVPAQKRNLDQILKAGWYLLELINEILDLALIESGNVTLSREPVSLVEVMLECQTMVEPQAQKRGIAMNFQRFDVPCFVNADRTRIKQVLINLLFNAIKYNKPGGAVTMDFVLTHPGLIRISIRDTGAGLAPEQLAQLFQPFNRLGKESGAEEGTGIGLVVTKRLVELMGGAIGVESTVGVGSLFWIELGLTVAPLLVVQHAGEDSLRRTQPVPGTLQRTLLYVEDNPANLELVEQLIAHRPDLRLLTAADGNLGIEFARAYLPEVILMDINLPGISGLEAMKILRADPSTARIPIIALSANAVPRDIEKALEAGFFNYVTKPIVVKQFMEALDVALQFAQTEPGRTPEKEQA